VQIKEGILSTIDLRQRKRLALLTAYLDDRPIYSSMNGHPIKTPCFGRSLQTALPELKHRGKTVLVISHDDRFHLADRMVKLTWQVRASLRAYQIKVRRTDRR